MELREEWNGVKNRSKCSIPKLLKHTEIRIHSLPILTTNNLHLNLIALIIGPSGVRVHERVRWWM